jgi:hypothetical protein
VELVELLGEPPVVGGPDGRPRGHRRQGRQPRGDVRGEGTQERGWVLHGELWQRQVLLSAAA